MGIEILHLLPRISRSFGIVTRSLIAEEAMLSTLITEDLVGNMVILQGRLDRRYMIRGNASVLGSKKV